jgi:hypothetical protein
VVKNSCTIVLTKTFRKVQGMQDSEAKSSTHYQSLDAANRGDVNLVKPKMGCVCGSMNSCPFLLLCLQGTDDVEMDDIQ